MEKADANNAECVHESVCGIKGGCKQNIRDYV